MRSKLQQINISFASDGKATTDIYLGNFTLKGTRETWPNSNFLGLTKITCFVYSLVDNIRYCAIGGTLCIIDLDKHEIEFLSSHNRSWYSSLCLLVTPFHGYAFCMPKRSEDYAYKYHPKTILNSIVIFDFVRNTQFEFLTKSSLNKLSTVGIGPQGEVILNYDITLPVTLNAIIDRGMQLSSIAKQLDYRLDEIDLALEHNLCTQPIDPLPILKTMAKDFTVTGPESLDISVDYTVLYNEPDIDGVILFVARFESEHYSFDFYMRETQVNGLARERFYRCYDYEPSIDVSYRTRLLNFDDLEFDFDKIIIRKSRRVYLANDLGELRCTAVPKLI